MRTPRGVRIGLPAVAAGLALALVGLALALVAADWRSPTGSASPLPAPPFDGPPPAPFEPVHAQASAPAGALELRVWGRRYRLGAGAMPEQIESQGVALLEVPARWQITTSEGAEVAWSAPSLESSLPQRATAVSTGRIGTLSAKSRAQVEFDGMIRLDLELRAAKPVRLDRVAYEWVLPETAASAFQHHLQYDYTRLRADKRKLLSSAGSVQPGSLRFPFLPTFLLANREVGLEWWSETNLGWAPAQGGPIRLERADGQVRLLIEPIGRPVPIGAGETWSHTFAVFPMPMRPEPARWRSVRFTSPSLARRVGTEAGARYYTIPFPGNFQTRWHGLPESIPGPEQAALRERLRKLDLGYVPYGKLAATPSLHPVPTARVDDWAATGRPFTGPAKSQRDFLKERGWQPRSPFGYAACIARWDYLAWMLKENLATLDAEQLDGLYFDIGSVFEPCQRALPPDADDKTQLWSYLNLRAFYRDLYAQVKSRNPQALIAIHTSGAPRALGGFVDFHFVGEALNAVFRDGHSFEALAKNPELYEPDYFDLPEGFLDAMLHPRVGGITSLLPQVTRRTLPGEERRGSLSRALLSWILVNDHHLWLTRLDNEEMVRVYGALDRFGNLDDARVHPWWNQNIAVVDPRLRITGYAGSGGLLLVIANWGDVGIESSVEIDAKRLDWSTLGPVEDLEAERFLSMRATDFHVSVPPRDFRLIRVHRSKKRPSRSHR